MRCSRTLRSLGRPPSRVDRLTTPAGSAHTSWISTGLWPGAGYKVLARHPILRTACLWEGLEEPLQVVRLRVTLPWVQEDWRGLSALEQQARVEGFLEADRRRGFELGQAPLMRCALLRMGEERYQFVWSFHHLLLD